jgi:hypothetical protein
MTHLYILLTNTNKLSNLISLYNNSFEMYLHYFDLFNILKKWYVCTVNVKNMFTLIDIIA